MLIDSRCLEFDGDGMVLPVAFTFTLRPIFGPFALITLVLKIISNTIRTLIETFTPPILSSLEMKVEELSG